jgi:parallel beta-helix repeat protein
MQGRNRCNSFATVFFAVVALGSMLGEANNQLFAATLCVNPGGTGGCSPTIGAAVKAASANDTIKVAAGTYKEDVVIGGALSLVGAGQNTAIIDATSLSNGVYIDGLDNPGLNNVVVTGFTVKNANFEGILVTNSSSVTVWDNRVVDNNKALNLSGSAPGCTGEPSFETDESFDCGGGIHLMGVDHSIIADNIIERNADGILLSDDTGTTHDNLITGNEVKDNPFDCGIVLASHPPGPGSKAPHLGVNHNTIANNESVHNGFQVPGAGAGVGIFADGTGPGLATGNVIVHNELKNNGLPGVAMHSHVGPAFVLPADNLNDNVIVGNHISGNGPDGFDTATPGPTGINVNSGGGGTPITGTVISGNVIDHEAIEIAVNTPAQVEVHLNNLLDDTIGVDNLGLGVVNATENWWGCPGGPGAEECAGVGGAGVLFSPWLRHPFDEDKDKK